MPFKEIVSRPADPWDFIGRCGIAVTNAEEVIVKNCWIEGGEGVGAIDFEPDEVVKKVVISNNVFEGYGHQGANAVTTGTAILMGSCGIPIQDVLIEGNFIFKYYRSGISFHRGGTLIGDDVVTRLTAKNNFIFDNGSRGISFTATNNAIVEGNLIYDSQGENATQGYAINASEVIKMRVAGNLEYGHKYYQVNFDAQSDTFTTGNFMIGVELKGTVQLDVSNAGSM